MVLCTDGLWSVIPHNEISTWLTSTPILKTAPQMMREAEKRGGADCDNLSAIVVRWGADLATEHASTTVTETLGLGEFETAIEKTVSLAGRDSGHRALSDEEIEHAIREIQSTIQKYRR
jgi:protein phosphatase